MYIYKVKTLIKIYLGMRILPDKEKVYCRIISKLLAAEKAEPVCRYIYLELDLPLSYGAPHIHGKLTTIP